MFYSSQEIKELGLGQLTDAQLEASVSAFNGLAYLLGKDWVDSHFQGAKAPSIVLSLESLWRSWLLIRDLDGSDGLLARWKGGEGSSVEAEILIFSRLASQGLQIELYPKINEKFPDCRFKVGDRWVYAEIAKRGISKLRKWVTNVLHNVAEAAAHAIPGKHGKVVILKSPDEKELNKLVSWLKGVENQTKAELEGLAIFWADPLESDSGGVLFSMIPEPRLFTAYGRLSQGKSKRGTAAISVTDKAVQEIIESKVSQLSRTLPGVVCLDISNVLGNYNEWIPLVQRRLQRRINTRISAVLLFHQYFHSNQGPQIDGKLVVNENARNHLKPREVIILEEIIKSTGST